MEAFHKLPDSLLNKWLNKEVRSLTIKIYLLFQQRQSLTKYVDESGEKYFLFTTRELAEKSGSKYLKDIQYSIDELEKLKLIKKSYKHGCRTRYKII